MATTLIDRRPSALPAVHLSIGSAFLGSSGEGVEAVLSLTPVRVPVRPAALACVATPVALTAAERLPATKINNYIGAPAAMAMAVAGATMSAHIDLATGELRDQQRGGDKVKGSDARGIPPRGQRPV